jgi:hypothetical protein
MTIQKLLITKRRLSLNSTLKAAIVMRVKKKVSVLNHSLAKRKSLHQHSPSKRIREKPRDSEDNKFMTNELFE